jgi:hypothetical protein
MGMSFGSPRSVSSGLFSLCFALLYDFILFFRAKKTLPAFG